MRRTTMQQQSKPPKSRPHLVQPKLHPLCSGNQRRLVLQSSRRSGAHGLATAGRMKYRLAVNAARYTKHCRLLNTQRTAEQFFFLETSVNALQKFPMPWQEKRRGSSQPSQKKKNKQYKQSYNPEPPVSRGSWHSRYAGLLNVCISRAAFTRVHSSYQKNTLNRFYSCGGGNPMHRTSTWSSAAGRECRRETRRFENSHLEVTS